MFGNYIHWNNGVTILNKILRMPVVLGSATFVGMLKIRKLQQMTLQQYHAMLHVINARDELIELILLTDIPEDEATTSHNLYPQLKKVMTY